MKNLPRDLLVNWNIVLIDDEEDSLMVASHILNYHGASIYTAENGHQGFELIQSVLPRFVLSDISMPIMDGWKLIELMKNTPVICDIPAIALTAHAMVGDRERAIAAGFHNYLSKPLNAVTFLDDVLNLLMDVPDIANALHRGGISK